jgi:hypothetical protein
MEKPALTRACLSRDRDILAIMRVPLVESLYWTVMEWILALEYMLSCVRGLLQPCPIILGNKCYHLARTWHW